MNNVKGELNKRVFDSIEEINEKFGVDLKLPEYIPEGCNLLCYEITDLYDVRFFHHYKLTDKLYHYVVSWKGWAVSNDSLELEILKDASTNNSKYIYLHLNKSKDKFTTERLLGVETTGGYIKDVHFSKDFDRKIITVQLFNRHWYCPQSLNFYISDDSDETVTLDEYIKLFYNTEDTL